jgi:hypothetical protein
MYAVQPPERAARRAAPQARFGRLYGVSAAMNAVFEMIEKVAPSDASVLLIGESGTGKELAANAIHDESACRAGAFVAINCGAFSANLIEAELFGYERGAFTGAVRSHRGCFERASGGTLFLDEITEMPVELQIKLLRALESGRFYRVGGEQELSVNVRIIAATNRDPNHAVAQGLLREDRVDDDPGTDSVGRVRGELPRAHVVRPDVGEQPGDEPAQVADLAVDQPALERRDDDEVDDRQRAGDDEQEREAEPGTDAPERVDPHRSRKR